MAEINLPIPPLTSEAYSVEQITRRALVPVTLTVTSPDDVEAEVILVPGERGGYSVADTKRYTDAARTNPIRRSGVANHLTIDSYVAHTNRFSDDDSAIFVSGDKQPSFLTIFDYHRIGALSDPRFGVHGATFAPELSPEWMLWTGANKKGMSQEAFGTFIDNRLIDLLDPPETIAGLAAEFVRATNAKFASKAELIAVSESFTFNTESTVKNTNKLSTGEVQIIFEEKIKGAGNTELKVPQAFLIAIPVFKFGPLIMLPLRLRFAKKGQTVEWHFDLFEHERALEAQTQAMIERVSAPKAFVGGKTDGGQPKLEGTGLPVFRGTPEKN